MRGQAEVCVVVGEEDGITPACAGTRTVEYHVSPRDEDHPRVCGDKQRRQRTDGFHRGSPPRVRGQVANEHVRNMRNRITPACAGTSNLETARRLYPEDHPRVCGDKLHFRCCRWRGSGITPACAGTSSGYPSSARRRRDHPRVCGDKVKT